MQPPSMNLAYAIKIAAGSGGNVLLGRTSSSVRKRRAQTQHLAAFPTAEEHAKDLCRAACLEPLEKSIQSQSKDNDDNRGGMVRRRSPVL